MIKHILLRQNRHFDGICRNFVGITVGVLASEIILVYDCNVILAAVKYDKAWRVKSRMILQRFIFFL